MSPIYNPVSELGVVPAGSIDISTETNLAVTAPIVLTDDTVSISHNTTNLKITSNALNTIQDIATTSSPTFGGLTISNATTPTLTITDTTDSGSAILTRTDSSALMSLKNTAQEGGIAYGLNYDTNTDTVAIATTTLLDGYTAQTWSFWIKTTQALGGAGYYGILSKFSGTDAHRSYDFRYRDVSAGNNRISVALRDSALVYNPNDEYVLTTDINDGNWHHIVFSWSYTTGVFNLYVDNVKLANVTTLDTSKTQNPAGANKAVELGSEKWVLSSLLAQYDEWASWSRKLTDGEIGDLYNSGNGVYITTGKTFASSGTSMGTNLVGLWHCDENTGTTIADSSGNSLTGTFGTTNPAWAAGHIASDGVDYEVTYLSHQDGGSGIRGLTTLGNTLGDTYVNAKTLYLQIAGASEWTMTAAGLYPTTNDGSSIGISGNAVSDFYGATGFVLDLGAGDVTITHSSNTLTIAGADTLIDIAAGIFELNNAVRFDTGVAIVSTSYSIGRDADGTNQLHFNVPTGASFEWSVNDSAELVLDATNLKPGANDGLALGISGTAFSDLFLAPGGIINWEAGNTKLTQATNSLDITVGAVVYTFDNTALQFNSKGSRYFDDTFCVFGTSTDSRIHWNTDQTNDMLIISLYASGSAAQSGNILICEINDDDGVDFALPAHTDPHLYIWSSDATAQDFLEFYHDQTNANIDIGAGDLLLNIAGGNLAPDANDGWALGTSSLGVSDVFLASGAVINFAGDVTATHSSNTLAFAGATSYTFDDKVTMSGEVVEDGTTTSSGAGAVAITGRIHEVTTTGIGDALTLANGTEGQRLTIIYVAEGAGTDTAILTPTSMGNGTTVTFAVVGDLANAVFTNGKWYFWVQGAVIA